jgi:hypothetical protein
VKRPVEPYVIVTYEWLKVVLEPHGPWNKAQLELLGIEKTSPGWLNRLLGTHITPELAGKVEDEPFNWIKYPRT